MSKHNVGGGEMYKRRNREVEERNIIVIHLCSTSLPSPSMGGRGRGGGIMQVVGVALELGAAV